ncbi:MAG TPA: GNAT family N-acetyltransferase [Firmicutes bacterium]|nr:GNAT family N-acetyltransferase [Candidatus Fermentithermobacillaceae bacterium]
MSTAIRDAQPGDAPDFSRLVPLSGPSFLPALFGPETEDILAALFLDKRNLFSYEFTRVAVAGGRSAGMLLGCTGRQRNRVALHTGRLVLQRSGKRWPSTLWNLIRAEMLLTSPRETDFYITSIAVYPEFRGRGIATALLLDAEKRALDAECRRLVLDVETENLPALNLYKKLGFRETRRSSARIRGTEFSFFSMIKTLGDRPALQGESET